jgi:hypothetical protein
MRAQQNGRALEDPATRLVELGNLARSPRESEARSIKEYLQHRALFQLTQRGCVRSRNGPCASMTNSLPSCSTV